MSGTVMVGHGAGWRPYAAIFAARFRVLLQYRAAALAGFGTQLFWGFIKVMIMEAFFLSSSAPMPMSLTEVVAYIWLGQATLAMLPWNVERELAAQIRSGAVASELLRPVDLYAWWFSRTAAWRLAPTMLRAGPMFVFAMAVLPAVGWGAWALGPPPSPEAALWWLASMAAALALGCAMTMLWNLSMMWTLTGDGATHLAPAMVVLFSGMVIPLPLLPDGLRLVFEWLPFAGLFDTPARIFTGHIAPQEAALFVARQVAWAGALVGLGRAVLARGLRRLVLQGG